MNYSDWVLASATVIGPIAAVQAQKWVERFREGRTRKNNVFATLMATRKSRLANEHVIALNSIELAFYGHRVLGRHIRGRKEQDVIDTWREYLDHLNNGPPAEAPDAVKAQWAGRVEEMFTSLLQSLAKALNYEFDRVQLQRGAYSPIAHGTVLLEQETFRKFAVQLLAGERVLKVEVHNPPAG